MRSFASVILHLLGQDSYSIMMLDEPEAFLHPPQARLIGEIIAKERSKDTQLFIATHSQDVLAACSMWHLTICAYCVLSGRAI